MSQAMPRYLVVTGMHRSGTTLTGQILSKYKGLHVIHEPLNKHYGLSGVDRVYPCDLSPEQGAHYVNMIDKMLQGQAGYIRTASEDKLIKAMLRQIIGGRTGLDVAKWRFSKLINWQSTPVLKDPFMLMLSASIARGGSKVVVLVRHPAAMWLSVRRMSWTFSYDDFAYPAIMRELSPEAPDLSNASELEKFAWLWRTLYSYVLAQCTCKNIHVLKHESLCVSPFEQLGVLESFLCLPQSDMALQFLSRSFFSDVAAVNGNTLHVMERDAKSLATSWYGRLPDHEELLLRQVCGALVEEYYGAWHPL